jgi:hypothetical protein
MEKTLKNQLLYRTLFFFKLSICMILTYDYNTIRDIDHSNLSLLNNDISMILLRISLVGAGVIVSFCPLVRHISLFAQFL